MNHRVRFAGRPNPATLVRDAVAGLPLLLLVLTAAGCDAAWGEHSPPEVAASGAVLSFPADGHGHDEQDTGSTETEAGEPTDYSIYHLESEWWDQHGSSRRLESLAGRVQVVSMVYTNCGHTCPRILMEMKSVETALRGSEPERVGFVLVSIDPERDTPDRLDSFAQATRLDPARWTLLSGSDAGVLELAMLLGVKFRRDSHTDFSHSNLLVVLDPDGEIVSRQLGLGAAPGPLLEAIRSALPPPRDSTGE